MCTILFANDAHPHYELILAGNRDEFIDRPSKHAHFWKDAPDVFAGRDLKACGTWTGVNRKGEVGFVTNYRDFSLIRQDRKSRGSLVTKYLMESPDPMDYLEALKKRRHQFNPFSLVVGPPEALHYYSNVEGTVRPVPPGIHGLSNHLLDTPWPKVERGKDAFRRILDTFEHPPAEALWPLLMDRTPVPDENLPTDTHAPLETERLLSTIFIKSPDYGTRFQTLLFIDRKGQCTVHEREWKGDTYIERSTSFLLRRE